MNCMNDEPLKKAGKIGLNLLFSAIVGKYSMLYDTIQNHVNIIICTSKARIVRASDDIYMVR